MLFNSRFKWWYPLFLYRILSLTGIGIILFVLLIILFTPSAANYEFSIYDVYPIYLWIALIAAFMIGTIILIISRCSEKPSDAWIFGMLIIFLSDVILLLMPLIRGYLNYGSGDVLTHIGHMKDIIRMGYIGKTNMYPVDHILGVTINFFTGLSFQQISMIIPPIFSLFFIISLYLLSTVIFSTRAERIILIIVSSVLLFGNAHLAFAPNFQAFMVLPLFFYLIIKDKISRRDNIFTGLIIIICSLLIIFHPLISICAILFLVFLKVFPKLKSKIHISNMFNINPTKIIFLMIILFCSWSSYLYLLTKIANPIINSIIGSGESISEFEKYSTVISQVQFDILYLIRLILSIYGASIIIGIISLICCIYLFIKITRDEEIPFIYLLSGITFFVFFIISLIMFFINGSFSFIRFYSIAMLFSIILIPTLWILMNSNNNNKTIKNCILLLTILAIILGFSIFNLYYSPIIKQMNQQVTSSEYFGMFTFYETRDTSYPIMEYGLSQDRIYDAIYGKEYPRENVRYGTTATRNLIPPDHFGYDKGLLFGKMFAENHYFLLTNQGKFFYQNLYPEFPQKWRFVSNDFERLKTDSSVQLISSNGNLNIYLTG